MKKQTSVKIFLSKNRKWKNFSFKNHKVFYKGFFFGLNDKNLKIQIIDNLIKKRNWNFLKKNFGNFSIVIKSKNSILLISDTSRSYPLYYYFKNKRIIISDFSKNIIKNVKKIIINKEVRNLSLMSGYTISDYTIYQNINTINAGQYIELKKKISKKFYIKFFPEKFFEKNYSFYKKKYFEVLDEIFQDLKYKIRDTKIYLALSAGDDSRLVASFLKKYGFNVECFSYGLKKNWEIKIAKNIAKKLDLKHHIIIVKSEEVRNFYQSKEFENYFNKYNNFDSAPSLHEVYPIKILKKINKSNNAIIMNGQPADGINGSYVSKNFLKKGDYSKDVYEEIIKKHYSLWPKILSLKNIQLVKKYINSEFKKYQNNKIKFPYQLMLFHSYQNRICKYLMKNYQVYENYKFNWYSPYMDQRFIKFWFSVPLKFHYKRNLSKKILKDENLFNLWNFEYKKNNNLDIGTNILRNFTKTLFLLNKKGWKSFDKRYFQYFNDNQLKSHIVSKNRWRNTKGFRSPISFLTARWLDINLEDI